MCMRRRSLTVCSCFVFLLLLAGCASHTRPATVRMSGAKLKSATKAELVARVNSEAAQIQTLNATVDIKASVGGSKKGKITEYTEVRGYILARKPGWLRMIGLFPVLGTRAFDMVSNGTTFKLWIPPKNRFIMGSNEVSKPSKQPLENLRPQHIYDALLLRPINPENDVAVLEQGFATLTDKQGQPSVNPAGIHPQHNSAGRSGLAFDAQNLFRPNQSAALPAGGLRQEWLCGHRCPLRKF